MKGDRPRSSLLLAGVLVSAVQACAPTATGNLACTAGAGLILESQELPESSGVVWSRSDAGVFWTVNDGPDGTLFAFDTLGVEVARIATTGYELEDVEAMAAGPCGDQRCLYLADTGDNGERRETVALHRVLEPNPVAGTEPVARTRFLIRYPDGPRDVEALFVLPDGGLHLLSKGRTAPPTLYRYPGPLHADSVVTLEHVQALGEGSRPRRDMVTGATAVPGTDRVLVRTYSHLISYRLRDGRLEAVPEEFLSLAPLQEPQGEAVAADARGRVLLTTEGGPFRRSSAFHLLHCDLPTD